ncbi:8-oxo-dGTP pyrophosphatase MutT (NUDIX family) [Catenulispora sp. EB89]|uniref:NUDIX domain-containing protein n=1 Tax=Catenulispora sp. EB89 TaxID=3156257 RepID=UPI003514A8F2
MSTSMRWTVHGSRAVYESPWVNVRVDDVELPSGTRVAHHVIEFPKPSVGAIVTDADQRLLLLWRHRHITDASGWEIPAGWAEPGEDLAEAVGREITEETGYIARELTPITEYHPLSGISTMTYTVFHGTDIVRGGNEPDADEAEKVAWFTPGEVRELLRGGQIVDGPSLTAVGFFLATLA